MRIAARIASVRQETPTVKSFRLDLEGREFHFLPGQWADCYEEIAGRLEVAGYSMTSSPLTKGMIELAVKRVGGNPVTQFLHERATVGDLLYVDGGHGECFYAQGVGAPLVLIAGGIGITPLISILRHVDEAEPDVSVTLLHSVGEPSELLFRDRLEEIARRNSRVRCLFTVTQTTGGTWKGLAGRIDGAMLRGLRLDRNGLFYVCGPPAMIDGVVALLQGLGVPGSHVKYERWWQPPD